MVAERARPRRRFLPAVGEGGGLKGETRGQNELNCEGRGSREVGGKKEPFRNCPFAKPSVLLQLFPFFPRSLTSSPGVDEAKNLHPLDLLDDNWGNEVD